MTDIDRADAMPEYRAVRYKNNDAWRVVDATTCETLAWECRRDDALLFAASPDLLEACRAAMVFTQDWHPAHWQLQDAIDKAEGRHD